MADDLVQLEDGEWMRIDRRLWDALDKYKFNERELVVLKKIIRWTYGCNSKAEDGKDHGRYCIIDNYEEAAKAIGVHRPALMSTLQALMEKQVIYAVLDSKPRIIIFNKFWASWKVPLRTKYDDEANERIIARNLNYSPIEEAAAEEAFKQMKKVYQFGTKRIESVHNNVSNQYTMYRKSSTKCTDSVQKKSIEPHENKPSAPPKESKNKESKETKTRARAGSKEFATLNTEDIIQFGFELNAEYELCNPTAEDHLAILTKIVKTHDRQTILGAVEELKQAQVGLADRLDWLDSYLEGNDNDKE